MPKERADDIAAGQGDDTDTWDVDERKRLVEALLARAKAIDLSVCDSLYGRRRWTVAWWQQRRRYLEELWWTLPMAELRRWDDDDTGNILRKLQRREWEGRGG